MAKVGREIIKMDVDELIAELNKGVAAELHDAFRYLVLSKMASGPQSGEVAELFAQTAQDEWNHLGLLIDRILQLGGRPITRPADAEKHTYVPYKAPPQDPTDLKQMIEDSLEGERAAIRYWAGLYEKTITADPVTARLAADGIADEVSDEDNLERLIEGLDKG